jgi:hypothetical protein
MIIKQLNYEYVDGSDSGAILSNLSPRRKFQI